MVQVISLRPRVGNSWSSSSSSMVKRSTDLFDGETTTKQRYALMKRLREMTDSPTGVDPKANQNSTFGRQEDLISHMNNIFDICPSQESKMFPIATLFTQTQGSLGDRLEGLATPTPKHQTELSPPQKRIGDPVNSDTLLYPVLPMPSKILLPDF